MLIIKLEINGEEVEWKNEVKYLGITPDKGLTWKLHIKQATDKTKAAMHRLYPLLGRRSHIAKEIELKTIKAFAKPPMTYGSVTWAFAAIAAKSYIKRIETTKNKLLRCAIYSPY